ncbi:MAG: class II aldolase/adducin family protein, partial [Halodesulfurarchaeum sp.]
LTPGRTGNLSVRSGDRVAITPTGVPYAEITPDTVPVIDLDGTRLMGDLEPSSEVPMHRGIYAGIEAGIDAGAIVHVHSPYATTLSVLRQPVPPVHYMLALAGSTVPVAEYATYGTQELAANVVAQLEEAETSACLLANHGLVALGEDAEAAIETARAVESTARVYVQAAGIGEPVRLSEAEMERVAERFESYGQSDQA